MSDPATQEREVERYPQIIHAILKTPWAIEEERWLEIREMLALRLKGQRFSEEEIQARIGGKAAHQDVYMAGSVAVIPLYGVIVPRADLFSEMSGGSSVQRLSGAFKDALADEEARSILLDVNSPGGQTDMVPEFAAEIRAARGTKPIVAVANTTAASAAYWLGSQADEFVASPSASVGSIGVFAAHDDISGMQEKMGAKTTLVSAGKYKVEGNPFEPLSEEARAAIQERVDEAYEMFVGDVAAGRGTTVEAVRAGYGQGRMLSAKKALAGGMIDRVATFESTLARLQNPSGRARVVRSGAEAPAETVVAVDSEEISNEAAEQGGRFADAVDEAHRALDAVVSGSEALRALTVTKRAQLEALIERGQELLAKTEASPETLDDSLELEWVLAEADLRLRL